MLHERPISSDDSCWHGTHEEDGVEEAGVIQQEEYLVLIHETHHVIHWRSRNTYPRTRLDDEPLKHIMADHGTSCLLRLQSTSTNSIHCNTCGPVDDDSHYKPRGEPRTKRKLCHQGDDHRSDNSGTLVYKI